MGDDLDTWASASVWDIPAKFLVPDFGLVQFWLLGPFGGMNLLLEAASLSVSLSTCVIVFQVR